MDTQTTDFINRSIAIHGDQYEYTRTEYIRSTIPLTVTCRIHGDFQIRPNNHLSSKQGCQKCSNRHRPTLEEFKQQAAVVHANKYDYSKVVYVNNRTKVEIICPLHGSFFQLPATHTCNAGGCPKCGNRSKGSYHKRDTSWFVCTAQQIHGDKYDYIKVNYERYHDKVEIICRDHGSFFQTAGAHISQKQGCPTCSNKNYEGGYGIKRFTNFPDLREKPGILYLVECDSEVEHFSKVGITQFSVEKRFAGQLPYRVTTIATVTGTMWELFQLEQHVKRVFKAYKYQPNVRFSGHTECFDLHQQQQIQAFITEKSIFK